MKVRRRSAALSALALVVIAPSAASTAPSPPAVLELLAGRPFQPVLQEQLAGDLLLAGNSNLLSAGGWRDAEAAAADVDGDTSLLCIPRARRAASLVACADNSSSADLDVPPNGRIVAARLYVETSTGRNLGPLQVRLDGPSEGFNYRLLPAVDRRGWRTFVDAPADVPVQAALPDPTVDVADPLKLYEAVADFDDGAVLRHAVWDVTQFVQAGGAGRYTVADIVNERADAFLPYASWTIVLAYELAPDVDLSSLEPQLQARFSERLVSWHDGFVRPTTGGVDVVVDNTVASMTAGLFGKSFHVVAHGRRGRSDNLLFDDGPVGNNLTPGDGPAPTGVVLGADPACNTITDVQNDTVCVLGTNVTTKSPGAAELTSSADGRTPSSGSGVDMDVIRIPDRLLWAAGPRPTLRLQVTGADQLAAAVLAVSIDVVGAQA